MNFRAKKKSFASEEDLEKMAQRIYRERCSLLDGIVYPALSDLKRTPAALRTAAELNFLPALAYSIAYTVLSFCLYLFSC